MIPTILFIAICAGKIVNNILKITIEGVKDSWVFRKQGV
jgi:hypothetical protein